MILGCAVLSSSDAWCEALLAFSQLPLASQGVFANPPPFRKSISKPGGDFATKGHFHSQGAFSQPISQLQNEGGAL